MPRSQAALTVLISLASTSFPGCFDPDVDVEDSESTSGAEWPTTSSGPVPTDTGSPTLTEARTDATGHATESSGGNTSNDIASDDEATSGYSSSSESGHGTSSESSGGRPDDTGTDDGEVGVLARNDRYLTSQGDELTVSASTGLLENDQSTDGDALVAELISSTTSQGGSIDILPDGGFSYTPPSPEFWGADLFSYRATNGAGQVSEADVEVMVKPRTVTLDDLSVGHGGFILEGDVFHARSGHSVAGGGDVNGDGFDDIIIGDYLRSDTDGLTRNGRAYVVYGSADIPDSPIALESLVSERLAFVVDGSDDYEMLGGSASVIGDVNADGYADLAVGAPDAEIGTTGTGRCYIVFGTANVPATPVNMATIQDGTHPGIIIESQQERSDLCWSINTRPGDINGDGIQDFITSGPGAAHPQTGELAIGASFVFWGPLSARQQAIGMDDAVTLGLSMAIYGESHEYVRSGRSLSITGDNNGDGIDDLAISAPSYLPNTSVPTGRTYILFGSQSFTTSPIFLDNILADETGFIIEGGSYMHTGHKVSGGGDFNGDDIPDTVINSTGYRATASQRVFAVMGSRPTTHSARTIDDRAISSGGFILGTESTSQLGYGIANAGDFNGDGLDEIIVSNYSLVGPTAFLIFGSETPLPSPLSAEQLAAQGYGIQFDLGRPAGFSASAAGDVNGDGLSDIVLSSDGGAYILLGQPFTSGSVRYGDGSAFGTSDDWATFGTTSSDRIHDLPGRGVIYGGPGDDDISLTNTDFVRIDGGYGSDTVSIEGRDVHLDLTTRLSTSFRSIETIDLGGGGNSLVIDIRHFTNLHDHTLTLRGDNTNTAEVLLPGAGFTRSGEDPEFNFYTNSALTLRISKELQLTLVL